MRNIERIDKIVTLIADIWYQYPDWRLTQILSNSNALGDSTDRIILRFYLILMLLETPLIELTFSKRMMKL